MSETALDMRRRPRTAAKSNRLWRFLKTPKGFTMTSLIVLALVSVIAKQDVKSLTTAVVGAATGFAGDLLVGMFYKKKRFVSDGGIITGLIVGMVLGSFTPWYDTAATTAIALASKHVLRVKRKPMFNPAAVGLLVANYAFASMQSWWGGMSLVSSWYLIVLVIAGVLVARRAKKLPEVIAFFVAYFLMCTVFLVFHSTHDSASYGFQNPLLNSALFLAFFMVTDPPTSPAKARPQIVFGAIVGVVSVGIYLMFPAELNYLLIGLLIANLYKWLSTQWFAKGAHQKARRPATEATRV